MAATMIINASSRYEWFDKINGNTCPTDDTSNFIGRGRKVLKKNKVLMPADETHQKPYYVNLLTQTAFQDDSGNDLENTVFVVKYDFALSEHITIPKGCILSFKGGSISSRRERKYTITGQDTRIDAGMTKIFSTDVIISGSWNVTAKIEWFGAVGDGVTDDSNAMTACLPFKNIELQSKTYLIKMVDILFDHIHIWGIGNATVYNDEWGPWCFRTSCDYIEIDHINFKAIPHIQVTRTYPGGERDNGASAILAKGSFCNIHDLYIEEFYSGVWFGGDYLDDNNLQEGNVLYNIKCHNLNFNPVAWQKDFVAHDIYGDCATFSATGYDGGKGTNPCHLIYLTGKTYNVNIYNIASSRCRGGHTVSAKYVIKGRISNIVSYKDCVLYTRDCIGVTYSNLQGSDFGVSSNTDAGYSVNISRCKDCRFENIVFTDSVNMPVFRVGSGCENVYVENISFNYIGSTPPALTTRPCYLTGSNNTTIKNLKFRADSLKTPLNYITVGTATNIINVDIPSNGKIDVPSGCSYNLKKINTR